MVDRTEKIKNIIEKRNIDKLLHFTRVDNLPTIIEHGVLSRSRLAQKKIRHITNDNNRLDNKPDWISISISYPNCRMLYKYREVSKLIKWAVLVIHPSVLWEKDCAFYDRNAANKNRRDLSLILCRQPGMLSLFFNDNPGNKQRRDQPYLRPCDPTNMQAEVLVHGSIEPEFIKGIILDEDIKDIKEDPRIKMLNIPVFKREIDGIDYFLSRSEALSPVQST